MSNSPGFSVPTRAGDPAEVDYSAAEGDDFDALSRDRVPVRSLRESDIDAVVAIDRKVAGRDRAPWLRRKLQEVMRESGVRVSLVAEVDDRPAGYIMARVDFGEYGRTEPEAVIDTLGVDPGFQRHGVGSALMSQLMANLSTLRVDRVRTELGWDEFPLMAWLERTGFTPAQRIVLHRPVGKG